MISQAIRYPFIFLLFMALMVSGCETEKMQETKFGLQQNYFLQSLELVESGGKLLQTPGLTQADIDKAMLQMDQGLEKAFQVEKAFLQQLDVRLPKLYAEVFIKGVESYRLGVESSDRQQQLEGLNLLSQWGKFWLQQQSEIKQKLASLNG